MKIITKKKSTSIDTTDILYIQRNGRKLFVQCKNGDNHEYYEKMSSIKSQLDSRFYWCLDSLVVNVNEIILMEKDYAVFSNGQRLMLSQNVYYKLRRQYNEYLNKTK